MDNNLSQRVNNIKDGARTKAPQTKAHRKKATEFSKKRTKAHPKVDSEIPNNNFITLTSEDA